MTLRTEKSLLFGFISIILGLIMAYLFYLARKTKNKVLKYIWYALAFLVPALLHLYWNFMGALGR